MLALCLPKNTIALYTVDTDTIDTVDTIDIVDTVYYTITIILLKHHLNNIMHAYDHLTIDLK